jgi:hypothetical protein
VHKLQIIDEIWEGRRGFAETFWLWHVLFANIFVARILSAALPSVIFFPLWSIVTIWTVVGLWRCASNNPGYWAVVVKIIIVIGLIDLFFYMFGISLHTY